MGTEVVFELARSYRVEDGIIYFSVMSNGMTGEQWIERLENKGFRVGPYAKQMLLSSDFKPTCGVMTEVAVLKGTVFQNNDRTTKKICAEADKRKFTAPNAEVACLIREKLTDKEIAVMGNMMMWYVVVMHEPINDSDGSPHFLDVNRDNGGRYLGTHDAWADRRWDFTCGFAFAVS